MRPACGLPSITHEAAGHGLEPSRRTRLARFAGIGAIGFIVQLASTWLLARAGLHYAVAAAAGVEAAVLHNFVWHDRWTWRDRTGELAGAPACLARLVRFHAANGVTSLVGNVLLTVLWVEWLRLPLLAAQTLAVVALVTANFALAERWVFAAARTPVRTTASAPRRRDSRAA